MISLGYGNLVSPNRVLSILSPASSPVKKSIRDAREKGTLIDATCGKLTRAVLYLDSGHLVVAAILPETIAARMEEKK
ncbi:MAG: hypothetical protein UV64_C0007G0035 [Parcubacteria group bacterium GW2011_GWC1_43_11b]|nr:MAG: hypothetical protein UV64_C0007G0035 [Parcubacteria group bacterium GW2011_GWC1_43_11b]